MLQDVKECEKSLDSGHGSMEEISHSEVSVPIFIHRDNILCCPGSGGVKYVNRDDCE
jgi:hypothetical protein